MISAPSALARSWPAIRLAALLAAAVASPVALSQPEGETVYLKLGFSDIQQVGFLARKGNDFVRLTFSEVGNTNVPVVRIDNDDFVFGYKPGKWIKEDEPAPAKGEPATRPYKSIWQCKNIRVTQTVQIVRGAAGKFDTAKVIYILENKDAAKEHEVGIRLLLDTYIVDNDGNTFAIEGKDELVVRCKSFHKGAVPSYVRALQVADPKNPRFEAILTLKLENVTPPTSFLITRLPLKLDQWDIAEEDMRTDSAAVLYWEPRTLASNRSFAAGYAYGLDRLKSE